MATLSAPTKKEIILKALSQVPIARTDQIAKLFLSNSSPLKKASQHLQELLREKLIEWEWHRRAKIWRLTRKGLLMMNGSRQPCEHIEHALEVGEIYFTLRPFQWLYEYKQTFDYAGRSLVWNPDVVFAFVTPEGKKKLACVEVQRTPLSVKQWQSKFSIYNSFFEGAYKTAEFQQWKSGAGSNAIIPHFYVVSSQKNVEGLNVPGRELKVISSAIDL